MSALTQRSALRLQLAQLDATECVRCTHPLSSHLPRLSGGDKCRCYSFESGKQVFCKCASFVERASVLPGLGTSEAKTK